MSEYPCPFWRRVDVNVNPGGACEIGHIYVNCSGRVRDCGEEGVSPMDIERYRREYPDLPEKTLQALELLSSRSTRRRV